MTGEAATPGDVVALVVVLAVTAALALWWRARQGRIASVAADAPTFGREALGALEGTTLLVEFTAPGCVPCARTKAVLGEAADGRDDVVLVTADVGEHLELARAHNVLRAPTTLVVDASDRVRHRVGGVPAPADIVALLDDALRSRR
jgi:thiol-disulfide isomerase/thioredoxin